MMGEKLPVVKPKEVIQALKRAGFVLHYAPPMRSSKPTMPEEPILPLSHP